MPTESILHLERIPAIKRLDVGLQATLEVLRVDTFRPAVAKLGLKPSAGEVYWHDCPISRANPNVSIVFQSFALFPWLTVLQNVEAPLQARGVGPEERRTRSMRMLDTVGLDGFESAYPKELSGGMKQRVGFARALVVEPEVLFMDEPFSALDVLTAENLRSELLELWAKKTMPTRCVFLVTHNIEEAVLLADRIIVLGRNPGHIRTDFRNQLTQPRDRKSESFTQLLTSVAESIRMTPYGLTPSSRNFPVIRPAFLTCSTKR